MEGSGRNVDVYVEGGEELRGDVNSAKVVEDTEVDIRREVRPHTFAHAVIRWWTFLDSEVDLLQQLAYYPRVPSRDEMKDSMESRGEECGVALEGMSERLGAYYLLSVLFSKFRFRFSVSTLLQDDCSFDSSVLRLGHHRCGPLSAFFLLTSCLSHLHPDPQ